MGKYEAKKQSRRCPFVMIPISFFLIELYGFFTLSLGGEGFLMKQLWPLAFGTLWAVLLSGVLRLLPHGAARVGYGIVYGLSLVYAVGQTGYFNLFSQMMWLSDFRYASEGSDYFSVILSYPMGWWAGTVGIILLGVVTLVRFPKWELHWFPNIAAFILAACAAAGAVLMPELVFIHDNEIQYAGSDYGRAQSAEAAYDNMFNTHRLYQVCGLYQTAAKDLYMNLLYPLTPGYARTQAAAIEEINAYLEENGKLEYKSNQMTGLLEGKHVVMVLMESMDDWMIGTHTPTLSRLMSEGIRFSNFYTPGYGGIRTFNTEFCINTGSFLSSQGGYAFDYVTNSFHQSLAAQLTELGYSAKTFHYNDPSFYSRGVFSPAMGYEAYVCYADYVTGDADTAKNFLYDDKLLFDQKELNEEFFEGSRRFSFIITRSAHLSYKYNEVLSHWALKQYPEYRGLTGNEETDCAYVKARLVDDMFARLLEELELHGQLEDTVIIGITDHYTYGYKDEESLLALSGVEEKLLLEKTPCFIWSPGLEPMEVEKTLNTSDLLPTVLNLLGVRSRWGYIGSDAFDEDYEGFVPFSNGSWITSEAAYDADTGKILYLGEGNTTVIEALRQEMDEKVAQFIRINNLILETDYYKE